MSKGYIISRVSVVDPEGWKAYVSAANEAIAKFGGKPLARGGRCEILEGEGRMRNVVLEFENFDQAKAYYYSPEYQAAIKHRLGRGVIDMVVVEGT